MKQTAVRDKDFIRLIWYNRLFDNRDLIFSDHRIYTVRSVGEPDMGNPFLFHGVELICPLSGTMLKGSARIDSTSSDYHKEPHDKTPLLLHIVGLRDKHLLSGQSELLTTTITPLNELTQTASRMALDCESYFAAMTAPSRESIKLRLLSERLERKGREIMAIHDQTDDWSETLYITLMRSFGYKEKKDEFERLARSVPYRYVLRHSHRAHMVEAIMLGQAGYLDVQHADEYTALLQTEWESLRHETTLNQPIITWGGNHTRPSSLPAISIVRVVTLLTRTTDLLEDVLAADTTTKLLALFDITLPVYWRFHYAPSREAEGNFHSPNMTLEKLNLIIINCISPFLWALGTVGRKEELIERSIELLEQTAGENNTYTRRWLSKAQERPTAFDSQSVIELSTSYCIKGRCTACPIGAYRLRQIYLKLRHGSNGE